MRLLLTTLATSVLVLPVASTMAAVIIPISATSSTSGSDFRAATNLINGSGLDASDPQNHLLAGAGYDQSWVTEDPTPGGGDYFVDAGANPVLVFDLGADTQIDTIFVWAYGGTAGSGSTFQGNSASDFTLRFATAADGTGGFGTSIATTLNLTAIAPPGSDQAGASAIPRDDITFGQTITTRYVEMTLTDNYFGAAGAAGGDRVGLGEIQFNQIPEPGTVLVSLLAVVPLFRRRRR